MQLPKIASKLNRKHHENTIIISWKFLLLRTYSPKSGYSPKTPSTGIYSMAIFGIFIGDFVMSSCLSISPKLFGFHISIVLIGGIHLWNFRYSLILSKLFSVLYIIQRLYYCQNFYWNFLRDFYHGLTKSSFKRITAIIVIDHISGLLRLWWNYH